MPERGQFYAKHGNTAENVSLKCKICGKSFDMQKDLFKHRATCKSKPIPSDHSNPMRDFECYECGSMFTMGGILKRHQILQHGPRETMPHRCETCAATFSNFTWLSQHMKAHRRQEMRRYKCSYCEEEFQHNQDLRAHLHNQHTICRKCGLRFESKGRLLLHQKVEHRIGNPHVIQCCYCSTVTWGCIKLERHLKRMHKGKNFVIGKCNGCFQNVVTKMHVSSQQLFCQLCVKGGVCSSKNNNSSDTNKTSTSNNSINAVSKPMRRQIFKCQLCPRVFHLQVKLKRHLLEHTENKIPSVLFTCKVCEGAFTQRHLLESHHVRAHPKLSCMICREIFSSGKVVWRHKKRFHWQEMQSGPTLMKSNEVESQSRSKQVAAQVVKQNVKHSTQPASAMPPIDAKTMESTRTLSSALQSPQCSKCHKTFSSQQFLKRHCYEVHSEYLVVFHCIMECGFYAKRLSQTRLHARNMHGVEAHEDAFRKSYAVNKRRDHKKMSLNLNRQCELNVPKKQKSLPEKSLKNMDKKKRYKCPRCPKAYSSYSDMSVHKNAIHSIVRYKCPLCLKHYSCRKSCSNHLRMVHRKYSTGINASDVKPIAIKVNNGGVSSSNNGVSSGMFSSERQSQIQMHNKKKLYRNSHGHDYESSEDQQKFGSATPYDTNVDLERYMPAGVKNPAHTSRIYNCILCPMTFSFRSKCLHHIERVHGKNIADEKVKYSKVLVESEEPDMKPSIAEKDELKSNYVYNCQLCQKTFNSYFRYWYHKRKFHERFVKIFLCPKNCGYKAKTADKLRSHAKFAHNINFSTNQINSAVVFENNISYKDSKQLSADNKNSSDFLKKECSVEQLNKNTVNKVATATICEIKKEKYSGFEDESPDSEPVRIAKHPSEIQFLLPGRNLIVALEPLTLMTKGTSEQSDAQLSEAFSHSAETTSTKPRPHAKSQKTPSANPLCQLQKELASVTESRKKDQQALSVALKKIRYQERALVRAEAEITRLKKELNHLSVRSFSELQETKVPSSSGKLLRTNASDRTIPENSIRDDGDRQTSVLTFDDKQHISQNNQDKNLIDSDIVDHTSKESQICSSDVADEDRKNVVDTDDKVSNDVDKFSETIAKDGSCDEISSFNVSRTENDDLLNDISGVSLVGQGNNHDGVSTCNDTETVSDNNSRARENTDDIEGMNSA